MSRPLLFTCTGCEKADFSDTGYWSHLQQSTDPRCISILKNHLHALDPDEEQNMGEGRPAYHDNGLDVDPRIVPFTGDVFGTADDYMDEDFGQSSSR